MLRNDGKTLIFFWDIIKVEKNMILDELSNYKQTNLHKYMIALSDLKKSSWLIFSFTVLYKEYQLSLFTQYPLFVFR